MHQKSDVETSLYYCNFRYYNPELCRWISPDSIEYLDQSSINGLNLYAYCNSNPVMNYDPTGHFTILALIIGFGISVAFEVVEDALDGELFTDDSHDWKDYLGAGISGLLGSMDGGKAMQIGLSVAGGMIDAWISGDIEENGFFNSLLSVGISSGASLGISVLANKLASGIKASSLKKMTNHLAKRNLGAMGITTKISSKTTKKALASIVFESNWVGNIIAENVSGSILGGITSVGYGHFSNLFGFYF